MCCWLGWSGLEPQAQTDDDADGIGAIIDIIPSIVFPLYITSFLVGISLTLHMLLRR